MYHDIKEVICVIEKIKITLPEKIHDLMKKDAGDFKILKPSGDENMNALVNKLVANLYEEFAADDDALRENIMGALSCVPEKYRGDAFREVMNAVARRDKDESGGRCVSLSFKPTRATERICTYIENVLLKNESISSFYRRLFTAYSKRPKNEREKIIHKENYGLLTDSVKRGLRVCITLSNDQVYNSASVYAVESARDELFNYALFYCDGKNCTVRLAKIKNVSLISESSEIPEDAKSMFARQIAAGAQYQITPNDNEPIKVCLTERGRALFEKIYLYRPTPTSIDGDVYTFDCSSNQVLYYFERFGSEALILSPKKLGIYMRNYYYFALKKYRSIYGKEK